MKANLAKLLGDRCPVVRICDVGALALEGDTPFQALLSLPAAELIGFEPNREECEKLVRAAPKGHRYFPYFVGDGKPGIFRTCAWPATSSLYEPNFPLLKLFSKLAPALEVKSRDAVETTRLDDIEELGRIDYLKIDVQGATLDVLHGASRVLAGAVVVKCEVEFVPLYEGEPLFADVDIEMRRHGYLLHQIPGAANRSFSPIERPPGSYGGQIMWTDATYVKSFLELEKLEPEQLLRLALIVELECHSWDLALLALRHYDAKTGETLHRQYLDSIKA
jgi:FkbM family methyltransferase